MANLPVLVLPGRSNGWGAELSGPPDDAVTRVYDDAGNLIETHEQAGKLKEW